MLFPNSQFLLFQIPIAIFWYWHVSRSAENFKGPVPGKTQTLYIYVNFRQYLEQWNFRQYSINSHLTSNFMKIVFHISDGICEVGKWIKWQYHLLKEASLLYGGQDLYYFHACLFFGSMETKFLIVSSLWVLNFTDWWSLLLPLSPFHLHFQLQC